MANASNNCCLLCGSTNQVEIDAISTDLVAENYVKAFGVDVTAYFRPGDRLSLIECSDCGLRYYDPPSPGDAAFYEALQRLPWYYQDIKPEYEFARKHVEKNDRVLEVGCGKGVFRSFLPESIEYRGLEFNQAAIDKARAQGLNVTSQTIENHADCNKGTYDVVCHFQVLEHVTDPIGFLKASGRAVKPGGKLIVAVPSEDSFLSICENGWLNMPPHHVSRWKDQTLRYALETELGLTVEDLWHEPVAEYHRDWHRSILINYHLKKLFGRQTRLSSSDDIFIRVARRMTKAGIVQNSLFSDAMNRFPFAKIGHTVCIVGKKETEINS